MNPPAAASGPDAARRTGPLATDQHLLYYGAPQAVQAGDTNGAFTVRINTQAEHPQCTKVVLVLPLGTDAQALTTVEGDATITARVTEGTGWSVTRTSAGTYEVTPPRTDDPPFPVAVEFTGVKVSSLAGECSLTATEHTPGPQPAASLLLAKTPATFVFDSLTARPTSVANAEQAVLRWRGPQDGVYQLTGRTGPIAITDKNAQWKDEWWSYTTEALHQSTSFVLEATTVVERRSVVLAQCALVTVTNPDIRTGTLAATGTVTLLHTPATMAGPFPQGTPLVAVAATDGLLLARPTTTGPQRPTVYARVEQASHTTHSVTRQVADPESGAPPPCGFVLPVPAGTRVTVGTEGSQAVGGDLYWIPLGAGGLSTAPRNDAGPPADPGAALLSYTIDRPVPLATGERARITLIVDTPSPYAAADLDIACEKIVVEAPMGTGATDLTAGKVSGTGADPRTWRFKPDTTTGKVTCTAKPEKPSSPRFPARLSLEVTINDVQGEAQLTVTETTSATHAGEPTPRTPTVLGVRKGPPGLVFQDFAAHPPTIARGGSAQLRWTARGPIGNTAEITVGDLPPVPVNPDIGAHTVDTLRHTAACELTAHPEGAKDPLRQHATIVVADPDLTARDLTVGGTVTMLGTPRERRPRFGELPLSGTAASDGILVCHFEGVQPPPADAADAVTITATVTPARTQADSGTPYQARVLVRAGQPPLTGDFVLPVPQGAQVTIGASGNDWDKARLTWIAWGAGDLDLHTPHGRPLAPEPPPSSPPRPTGSGPATAARGPGDFYPDTATIAPGKDVVLSWTAPDPSYSELWLLYHDRDARMQRPVTGTTAATVRGLTDTTVFTLWPGPPDGDPTAPPLTATVVVATPDQQVHHLAVDLATALLATPEPLDYTFTQPLHKTAGTDGFLAGWIQDTSEAGCTVTATVTAQGTEVIRATATTAGLPGRADGPGEPLPVPDNFLVPVPAGALLTIEAATHPPREPDGHTGNRTSALVWIPLGTDLTHP
ncbi:hypothetical protein [Streptomyces buecherae]|uniref:Uncharacterized protein n=1 Tax=Streptomyces buecherae TaxID=2763006 RepID=A0A7H8NGR2_9ACTN|nr:hypothetical protein [Streptomyces buecherae]QKW53600.1 hypothetical protein HUT08_33180 [Streptomyces buecherae]